MSRLSAGYTACKGVSVQHDAMINVKPDLLTKTLFYSPRRQCWCTLGCEEYIPTPPRANQAQRCSSCSSFFPNMSRWLVQNSVAVAPVSDLHVSSAVFYSNSATTSHEVLRTPLSVPVTSSVNPSMRTGATLEPQSSVICSRISIESLIKLDHDSENPVVCVFFDVVCLSSCFPSNQRHFVRYCLNIIVLCRVKPWRKVCAFMGGPSVCITCTVAVMCDVTMFNYFSKLIILRP
jgi:hypothetical protein